MGNKIDMLAVIGIGMWVLIGKSVGRNRERSLSSKRTRCGQ